VARGKDSAPQSDQEEGKGFQDCHGFDTFALVPEVARPMEEDSVVQGQDRDSRSIVPGEDSFDEPHGAKELDQATEDASPSKAEPTAGPVYLDSQLTKRPAGSPLPRQRTMKGTKGNATAAATDSGDIRVPSTSRFGMYSKKKRSTSKLQSATDTQVLRPKFVNKVNLAKSKS